MGRTLVYFAVVVAVVSAAVFVVGDEGPAGPVTEGARLATLRIAQVWTPTVVSAMDVRHGPRGHGAFEPEQVVSCRFLQKQFDGATPKFECVLGEGDEVKVKYGRDNGEVYAEVAASRLLWALGFGADRMYPVRVMCRGCRVDESGVPVNDDQPVAFDPAVVERKFGGADVIVGAGEGGWAWPELAVVDEREGGAPLAHRDALTLLAAMLQHTDSKPEQQRIVCLSPVRPAARNGSLSSGAVCDRPFLLIQDLGKTFGRSHPLNSDATASVSLDDWRATPVWDDPTRCVARLQRSATGTLANPRISETGRAFLAGLLAQITDAQLRDLFDVARFPMRATPGRPHGAAVEEWVDAFKQKRDEIASVTCR